MINFLPSFIQCSNVVIDRVEGEIIRLVASVCVSVRLSVGALLLNRLTLIFGMRVDLDLDCPGIVGQGCRSKVKVKQ